MSVLVHGGGEVVDLSGEEITSGDTVGTIVCNLRRVARDQKLDGIASGLVSCVPACLKSAAVRILLDEVVVGNPFGELLDCVHGGVITAQ